jgi:hypothetical protein
MILNQERVYLRLFFAQSSFAETGAAAPPPSPHGLAVPLVTGIVGGLVDNLSGQKSGLNFTVTSSINTLSGGWDVFTRYNPGIRFDVSGGQIQGVNIGYSILSGSQRVFLDNLNLSVQH